MMAVAIILWAMGLCSISMAFFGKGHETREELRVRARMSEWAGEVLPSRPAPEVLYLLRNLFVASGLFAAGTFLWIR